MGVRLQRFPEFSLELYLYSGVTTCEEMLKHFRRVDAGANWLSYFDATTDLSAVDVAHVPVLKRAITAKEDERPPGEPGRHALVNVPEANEQFVQFWSAYARAGVPHAHVRATFPTVAEACAWLGLPPDGCESVGAAVERAEAAAPEPAPAAERVTFRASPG